MGPYPQSPILASLPLPRLRLLRRLACSKNFSIFGRTKIGARANTGRRGRGETKTLTRKPHDSENFCLTYSQFKMNKLPAEDLTNFATAVRSIAKIEHAIGSYRN